MKPFKFPLERVLEWRRAQAVAEELKLTELQHEKSMLSEQLAAVSASRERSARQLHQEGAITGATLRILDGYQAKTLQKKREIAEKQRDCAKRIEQQQEVVREARRAQRLLEKLREYKRVEWKYLTEREIEQTAGETYLAKWGRNAGRRH